MQNNDFDFVKYLNSFMTKQPPSHKYINDYLAGKITKQQLDEFMKGVRDEK